MLYLLDRFALSDEAYHELASITRDLPPLYQVKQQRRELNEGIEVIRLTGGNSVAYRPVKEVMKIMML